MRHVGLGREEDGFPVVVVEADDIGGVGGIDLKGRKEGRKRWSVGIRKCSTVTVENGYCENFALVPN